MSTPTDRDLVFNIVWTGSVFTYLRYFVASQIAQSDARFRFIANACPPDQVERMERFATSHPDRVVEVFEVSSDTMIAHGVALDRVRAQRDDGDLFCLIDPDIKANGPFVADLAGLLGGGCVAVTSGKEVWSESNLVPPGHPGVAGEFFFSQDGFVFGSPHLALYDRRALDDTCARWGVGLGSGGPDVPDHGKAKLAEMGHDYIVYDTGKLVNIFLQADGHALVHRDLPQLVHIGGVSHFLAPTGWTKGEDGERLPNWARWPGDRARYDVASFTGATLRSLCEGGPLPVIPDGLEPSMEEKLVLVRDEMADLIETYGSW